MNILDADTQRISPANLRILVIDDTRLTQHIVKQQLLENGYKHIVFAESPLEVRQHLNDFAPHIVLLDWMMPHVNGLALTKMIRARDKVKHTHTYVLMITGKDGHDAMMQAFQVGVDDFIAKADVASQLSPRLYRALSYLQQCQQRVRQMQVLRQQLQKQYELMTLDPATELPTLKGFERQFSKLVDIASARHQGLSCLLLRLTNYSALKSQLSEPALQTVLELFVGKLLKQLRPNDFVARTGDDEFSVLIPHAPDFYIASLDRVERSLDQLSVKTTEGFQILTIRTARAILTTDMVAEEMDQKKLREFLRKISVQPLPLAVRLRYKWPATAAVNSEHSVQDFIFTD